MAKLETRLPTLIATKEARDNRRMTQKEIAVALEVSESTVSRWMRGEIEGMTLGMAFRLCEYLGCELGDLVYINWEGQKI
jgi:DNA-binding Xre family transcriptional regulator